MAPLADGELALLEFSEFKLAEHNSDVASPKTYEIPYNHVASALDTESNSSYIYWQLDDSTFN